MLQALSFLSFIPYISYSYDKVKKERYLLRLTDPTVLLLVARQAQAFRGQAVPH